MQCPKCRSERVFEDHYVVGPMLGDMRDHTLYICPDCGWGYDYVKGGN